MMERFETQPNTPVAASDAEDRRRLPFDQDLRRRILGDEVLEPETRIAKSTEETVESTARNVAPQGGETEARADTARTPRPAQPSRAKVRAMQSERPARPASPAASGDQPAMSAPEAAPSAEPVSTLLPPQLAAAALAGREVSDTWSGLKPVRPGPKSLFAALGHDCDGPVAREFDILRTEVLQVLRSEGWKRIGVVAPHAGCGTTFTAINLACGLARVEQFRTLLVDLNQRAPGLHKALDLPWRGNIADLLEGDYHVSQYARAYSDTLALLLNAATSPASADLLHRTRTAMMLEDIYLSLDPGVVVFDLPPLLDYDDLSAFAPNLDAVLLVASAETTTSAEILDCERKLSGHVPLLGVVLNKTKQARP